MNALYFVVFLGVLIFVHELGHFLLARAVGVRVLRFSIGFGPRILGFKRGETEYWLSAIPLGGYVKFLGDDPENPPAESERRQGFLTTDLKRKVPIVLAGPLFNLVFPLLVYFPMSVSRDELPPSVLGSVARGGPAWEAGLRPGDRIVEIGGRRVDYFWELQDVVSGSPGVPVELTFERDGGRQAIRVTPTSVENPTLREMGISSMAGQIEVSMEGARPVIHVRPGSPAALAGIPDWSAVLAVDGREVRSYDDFAALLKAAATTGLRLRVAPTTAFSEDLAAPSEHVLGPLEPGADAGIEDAEMLVSDLVPDSPAATAGMKVGDRILALDGREVGSWLFLTQFLERAPDAEHTLRLRRESGEVEIKLSLLNPKWTPGATVPKYAFGVQNRRAVVQPESIPNRSRLRYGLNQAVLKTKRAFTVTAAGLWGLATLRVSHREMGGIIMIYQIASTAGRRGLSEFFDSMAWLSVSLGLLNLLPIPVLDGGHLVLFGLEAIRRKPVGRRGRQLAAYIGIAFLLGLMVLVFVNDIQRTWGGLGS
jgi:regulator of sigma E protease